MELQDLMHRKVFGDYLPGTRTPQHRREDWQKLVRGRERAVRTIARSLLGAPSHHQGDNGLAWAFQFATGQRLVFFINKGLTLEIAVSDETDDVLAYLNFFIDEMARRVALL
jgi:hypothetical protein